MRIKALMSCVFLIGSASLTFAQKADSTRRVNFFSGSASVTNNGISLIPTFSLSKPAALFKMSLGKNRFSFDPEFNFSMAGKPWYFLFWFRYKIITDKKFKMNVGAHLGLNFRRTTMLINSNNTEVVLTDRYVVAEVIPNYSITKHISIGIYYLHSRGLDVGTTGMTNFVTLNASFSEIKLSDNFFIKVVPQFYYLKMDKNDGYYITSALTLARKRFPLSLSSVVNKVIQTKIVGSSDLVWNATLTYSL